MDFKGPSDIYKIVKMIMVKNYSPVIVFAFSKRECEALALQMSKLEFNTDEEKEMVANVFTSAISGLSEDDRALPQIEHILPLLKRGIGIHHGGLLPILKEASAQDLGNGTFDDTAVLGYRNFIPRRSHQVFMRYRDFFNCKLTFLLQWQQTHP